MSPVSFWKATAAGARIQGPLTLSETCTWPAALYWANHPTSRLPWATGPDRVRVVDATLVLVVPEVPCTKAGEAPGAVTWRPAEGAEWLPAASKASTV